LVRGGVGVRRELRPVAEVAVDSNDRGRDVRRRRKHACEDRDDDHEGNNGRDSDDGAGPMRLRGNPRGAVAPATAVRESVSVDQTVRRALAERETVDGPGRQAVYPALGK